MRYLFAGGSVSWSDNGDYLIPTVTGISLGSALKDLNPEFGVVVWGKKKSPKEFGTTVTIIHVYKCIIKKVKFEGRNAYNQISALLFETILILV